MTCKECLHYEACNDFTPTDLDKDVWHYCKEGRSDEIPDIEERCSSFKDSTNYVEVVRCKSCKHWIKADNGSWLMAGRTDGACQRLMGIHLSERYMTEGDHFCSYGERREGE